LNSAPEIHIFKNAFEFFELKHDIFIQDYLSDCFMGGDVLNGSSLHECPLTIQKNHNKETCYRIFNAILNSNPLIKIHSICVEESEYIFDIYYINNFSDIEDFYCVKTTKDFIIEGVTLYQFLEVNIKSLDMINDFWLTSEADLKTW